MQDINTVPKEPKTERGCSRRQLFRHYFNFFVFHYYYFFYPQQHFITHLHTKEKITKIVKETSKKLQNYNLRK